MNIYGVSNQPTAPATFTIRQPHVITMILDYHWNDVEFGKAAWPTSAVTQQLEQSAQAGSSIYL